MSLDGASCAGRLYRVDDWLTRWAATGAARCSLSGSHFYNTVWNQTQRMRTNAMNLP
jgi:hypothetical protein